VDRFTLAVLRHRRWIFLGWTVALVAGVLAAGQLGGRLSRDFSLPGQEGWETGLKIEKAYGAAPGSVPAFVPVVTVPPGQSLAGQSLTGQGLVGRRAELRALLDPVRTRPGWRVLDYGGTGDPAFLTDSGRSTFALVYAPSAGTAASPQFSRAGFADLLQQRAAHQGLQLRMTGYRQLSSGNQPAKGPDVLTETLIGAVGALVVLVFVFASFLASVPLLVAAVSILSTFMVVLGLTTFSEVSFVVQFLIALVGLGVAVDYSLLVVTRWREERARGADNQQAVVTAMRTAGHAVLASGVTVAVSLVALVLVPVPMLRSMGFGGMLIPAVSVLVVLTLLPALLASVGPRIDWPRIRRERDASRAWSAWARGVVRWRWLAAGVAAAALALAIAPVADLQIGESSAASRSAGGQGHDTLVALQRDGVGDGLLTPMSVLVKPGGDVAAFVRAAQRVPGVRLAAAAAPGRDGSVAVDVVPVHETVDNHSVRTVSAVRDAVRRLPGYGGIAGLGATVQDYGRAVYGNFPYVLAAIALVTFVLLARTFRSLLLPLKAVLLNLVSVAAVFGVTTWIWQEGHGSQAIFGVAATGALTFWLPALVFAFLFGLSMDYEVFILARMREEYDASGSTAYAVEAGLGRTGRLVTSAALILFFAFAALASTPDTDIKVFATALGLGILLDATVVRALLVPALVSLFGRWNWWLPAPVARILRVEPSPLAPAGGAPEPLPEPAAVLQR
jgi:RND superfamily putative drug exporter